MKSYLFRGGIAALGLLASAGIATAAGPTAARGDHLTLTTAQQRDIWQGVSKQAVKEAPPAGFKATMGEAVPASIKLQSLPSNVSNQVPAVKSYDYAMLQKRVLIVDPTSKKIVDIVTQ